MSEKAVTWRGPFNYVTLNQDMECLHMTSRRPYWCPKTMKRWPCWCPKPILWELNSFLMQTLSFVPINLHRCWPREWKHSIEKQSPQLYQVNTKICYERCHFHMRVVIAAWWRHCLFYLLSYFSTLGLWFFFRLRELVLPITTLSIGKI